MAKSRHDPDTLIGGALIVCRRYDGRKESWDFFGSASQKRGILRSHMRFRRRVQELPHHRPRFAYIVNVYPKG